MAISAGDVKALRDQTGAGMMECKRALSDADGDVEKAIELLRERGLSKAGKRAGRATSEGAVAVAIAGARAGLVELGCETDFVAKTDAFLALAQSVADVVAANPSLDGPAAVGAAKLGGTTVADTIQQTIAKVGENIELKRAQGVDVGKGVTGGYVHMGGKLGVVVGLATGASGAAVEELAKDVAMHVAAADPSPIAVDRDGVDADVVERERRILTNQAKESGKPDAVVEKMVSGRINKFFAEHCLLEQAFVKDPDTTIGKLVAKVAKDVGADVAVASFVRFRIGEGGEATEG
ncbi:MAG: translation elongation factor Ts [Myxococcota bacterium]